jgi:5'-nucleotidase
VERKLATTEVDLLFAPGVLPIAYLETTLPMVIWSDCTFASMIGYYEKFSNLSQRTIANGHKAERRTLERCDLVICLSHLGYRYGNPSRASDQTLAAGTEGIDLIIGGHTHTFMEKAEVATNRSGEPVLIQQVGCFGINLGRVDFYFHPDGRKGSESLSITV